METCELEKRTDRTEEIVDDELVLTPNICGKPAIYHWRQIPACEDCVNELVKYGVAHQSELYKI